jgi:glyoxylase-like metal-dependent hydrolase (beta-lactamase superfamily II)
VYADELRAFEQPRDNAERTRYRSVQFAHNPKWSSYRDLGEPWFGFTAVREFDGLPPEIMLIPLAGHTRGHAGVAVDTGDGWLLHAMTRTSSTARSTGRTALPTGFGHVRGEATDRKAAPAGQSAPTAQGCA